MELTTAAMHLTRTVYPVVYGGKYLETNSTMQLHNFSLNFMGGTNRTSIDPECFMKSWDPVLTPYRFVINVIILGFISVIGVIGNIITFIVLKTDKSSIYKGSSSSTSVILLSLAVCDALFALSSVLVQLLPSMLNYLQVSPAVNNVSIRIFPFAFYFGSTVRMIRNWTIVLVSIERWIAIFKPLHAQVICTITKAKFAVVFNVLVASLYNVPRFIEALPLEVDCGTHVILVWRSPLRQNWAYQYVYMITLYMTFVIAGPLLLLAVLNYLLMRAIRKVATQHEKLMESTRSQSQTSRQCKMKVKYDNGTCVSAVDTQDSPGLIRASATTHRSSIKSSQVSHRFDADSSPVGATSKPKLKTKAEVTRMCVGIIMLFIICEIPALIYQIMYYLKVPRSITAYVLPISNGLVALNSALNFFVYVFLGKRFRSRVRNMLRSGCCYSSHDAQRQSKRLKLLTLASTVRSANPRQVKITADEPCFRQMRAHSLTRSRSHSH